MQPRPKRETERVLQFTDTYGEQGSWARPLPGLPPRLAAGVATTLTFPLPRTTRCALAAGAMSPHPLLAISASAAAADDGGDRSAVDTGSGALAPSVVSLIRVATSLSSCRLAPPSFPTSDHSFTAPSVDPLATTFVTTCEVARH